MLFLIIHDLCEVFVLNNQLIGDEFLSPKSRWKKYISHFAHTLPDPPLDGWGHVGHEEPDHLEDEVDGGLEEDHEHESPEPDVPEHGAVLVPGLASRGRLVITLVANMRAMFDKRQG